MLLLPLPFYAYLFHVACFITFYFPWSYFIFYATYFRLPFHSISFLLLCVMVFFPQFGRFVVAFSYFVGSSFFFLCHAFTQLMPNRMKDREEGFLFL